MTKAESILEQMFPGESWDNENKQVLSKVKALEFSQNVAWEIWKDNILYYEDEPDMEAEKVLFEHKFNRELGEE